MKWPCPKCGCSHEVEKGLHERWGCYLDTDENRRDGIEWRKDEDSREAQQAEKGGRLQTQTGAAQGSGRGFPGPSLEEIRAKVYEGQRTAFMYGSTLIER